ncbi:MAG: adenylate/guanylate cyclase domain-containing protein [Coleofasciculaceae cyanobacterium]
MKNNEVEANVSNILVIDDNPNNLLILSKILTHKYEVRSVTNGKMGLMAAQAAPPDLILLDINMPQMNGYEVCQCLKDSEQTRDIPVIFISALTEAWDKVKAFTVGAVDYITKPFQIEDVLVRVENQLARRQLEKQLIQKNIALQKEIRGRQRAEEEIKLLLTVTQAISKVPDFSSALEVALSEVCQATSWSFGEAWIPNAKETALECSPAFYYRSAGKDETEVAAFQNFRQQSIGLHFQPNEGLPGRVWQQGKSEWIPDVSCQSEAIFLRYELAQKCGFKAGLAVPIVISSNAFSKQQAQGKVLAVLVFFMMESPQQDQRLIEVVSAVAAQLGTVIQQKKAEAALRDKEKYLRLIIDNIPQQIFWKDTNSVFVGCNKNWANAAQLDNPEAVVGMTDYDLIADPKQADYYRAQDRKIMETDQAEFHLVETKQKKIEGQNILLDVNKIPIHDSQGNVIGILGVLEDITQRQQAEIALRDEQEKSERLLLNILPKPIADQLKQDNSAIAEQFQEVTIMFADIVDFTPLASRMSPTKLVNLLNEIFSCFDKLAEQHNLEKIKTIGDAYMVVAGVPIFQANHAEGVAEMALDMQRQISNFKRDNRNSFQLRIGINTGSVVAGVIGIKKFSYDLWGDAVNLASRMETQGIAGKIQVTAATYQYLKDKYLFEKRGSILVKGRGEMITYWLKGRNVEQL